GKMAAAERPASTAEMAASWAGRKWTYPKALARRVAGMGITPLMGYWSWTAIDLTGSGIRVRHFAFESHRSALMGFAPLYPSYERERSPPGMKKPPGGGFFARTRCALELRAGVPDGLGDVELLEVLDE